MKSSVSRLVLITGVLSVALALVGAGCTTMPDPKMERYSFPEGAYVGDVQKPYTKLGVVRTKVNYGTLDWIHDEDTLCKNYYNKAVQDLVRRAKAHGGDAVIDVKSVVFMDDGTSESYDTPQCADDGAEGQILAQGVVIKWVPDPKSNHKSE